MREERMVPRAEPTSYYGRPVLKEPVWKWMIPAYFFTGGVAAGSALLAFGARRHGNRRLRRAANVSAVAGSASSAALLIADLGRPQRFVNMLRVAKVSSPMSVGTWLLAGFGPATGVAAASDVTGLLPGLGRAAERIAALLAPAVATYTAVLVADTAVPAWRDAGDVLPFLFASGAAASAGALAVMIVGPVDGAPARRLALAGAAGELVAGEVLGRRLGDVGEVYEQGEAGRLGRISKVSTALGAAALALGGRRRAISTLGAALVLGGAAAERFAVMDAGRQSARDPKYTVEPQRARVDARREERGDLSAVSAASE